MSKLEIRENQKTDAVALVNLITEETYCLGKSRIPLAIINYWPSLKQQQQDKTEIRC